MSDEELQGLPLADEEISTGGAEEDAPPAPVWYVSYNAAGELTGYYFQVVHPDHEAAHIVLDGPLPQPWVVYRANAARDGVEIAPPAPPDVEQLTLQFRDAVSRRIEQAARDMGYDNILSAVSYADEPAVLEYQAEGRALRRWRSLVWKHCEDMLSQVQSGAPIPTEAEVLDGLPALVVDESETPAA